MAKVKNISGVDLIVPAHGGLVLNKQTIEVADEEVYGLTCQVQTWAPTDNAAKEAHAAAEKASQAAAEHPAEPADEEPHIDDPDPLNDTTEGD